MNESKTNVIEIDNYCGPLEVLLTLLEKNAMDIWDVNISTVINQYLDYVKNLETDDLDLLSRFSIMAATLISIKAESLFPKDETSPDGDPENDPREELAYQLIQYKMYKYMAGELRALNGEAEKVIYRDKHLPKAVEEYDPKPDLDKIVAGKTLDDLQKIYQSLMEQKKDRIDPVRSKFGKIRKERISVEDYQKKFREYLSKKKHFRFKDMLKETKTDEDKIVAFLSVLELAKKGDIRISQETMDDDIIIDQKRDI